MNVSPEEALSQLLSTIAPLEAEQISCADALNRVLAQDIFAPHSLPAFPNSGMDGYAVRVADVKLATPARPARLHVASSIPAGTASDLAVTPGAALRIMTGAPVPPGTEAIVPIEHTRALDDGSVLICQPAQRGQHIRPAGEDITAVTLAIPAGQVLRPQEIGLLSALGHTHVAVVRRPRVAILSSGDELIEACYPLAPGKIHDSNAPALAALVRRYGGIPILLGIARDNMADLRVRLRQGTEQRADLFLTSAGASAGDYDLIKDILVSEGTLHFWRVDMKPGRPLMFGQIEQTPLLGLPGNPAAALITAELFARPAMLRMGGRTALAKPIVQATLQEPVKQGPRRHYVRGTVRRGETGYCAAVSSGSHGAGSLTSLVAANALLVIPPSDQDLPSGTEVAAIMVDWPEIVE